RSASPAAEHAADAGPAAEDVTHTHAAPSIAKSAPRRRMRSIVAIGCRSCRLPIARLTCRYTTKSIVSRNGKVFNRQLMVSDSGSIIPVQVEPLALLQVAGRLAVAVPTHLPLMLGVAGIT